MITVLEQLDEAVHVIREQTQLIPEVGLILGSGLGYLADRVAGACNVSYSSLPGFPVSTVEGHAGTLVLGMLEERKVAVMRGRFHYYEGYSLDRIALGVRLLHRLGVRILIITNAAGGIRSDFVPGDLMLITDHINLMGSNPLIGPNFDSLGPRFPDMSDAYTLALREQAKQIAKRAGVPVKEGVYAAFTGPSYETPAEIRMLKTIGADAVGMSTIPETISACHAGMQVLGISCISNMAAGFSKQPLSHAEVTETANQAKESFSRLVLALVHELH